MPAMKHGTAYNLDGPADAPVVVLIHGLGLTRESTWAGFIPHLADRFRVLSYDLLGHGQSELPDGDVDLASLSEQLVALMDGLEIGRAALVGFSLGGMINRRCAMDHPDRVTALVVLNSPHDRGAQQQALVEKRADDTAAGGPQPISQKPLRAGLPRISARAIRRRSNGSARSCWPTIPAITRRTDGFWRAVSES